MRIVKQAAYKYITATFVVLLLLSTGATTVQARGLLSPRSDTDDADDKTDTEKTYTKEEIKSLVQDEFGKNHPMVDVARCESSFRQFTASGDVVRNPRSDAIGIFQILEDLHEEPADKLGFDIFTVKGNIGYARKLYDSFGLAPWSPSSLCWDDGNVEATNPTDVTVKKEQSTRVPVRVRSDGELEPLHSSSSDTKNDDENDSEAIEPVDNPVITKKLVSGVRDPQVRDLQRLLNDLGYRLSSSGPGSPGEETNFFGAKTRAAVKEFQCEQDIVCSGGRYTSGYGLVDKKTRDRLNKLAADRRAGRYRIGSVRVRTGEGRNKTVKGDTDDQSQGETTKSQKELVTQINKLQQRVIKLQAKLNE